MNLQDMTDSELNEGYEAWLEQYHDTLSQHRAECAGFGDSWPGAELQLDRLWREAQRYLDEINRRYEPD
jgi:hypothetical protein